MNKAGLSRIKQPWLLVPGSSEIKDLDPALGCCWFAAALLLPAADLHLLETFVQLQPDVQEVTGSPVLWAISGQVYYSAVRSGDLETSVHKNLFSCFSIT